MAHTYAHLYGLPVTGLRFFTVYGPWGRPDMAYYKFTKALYDGQAIDVYNNGDMRRDFTYIDDIVEGVIKVLDSPALENAIWNGNQPDPCSSADPWRIYNIGNDDPIELLDYIESLELALGKKAIKEFLPLQLGDIPSNRASVDNLAKNFGYKPTTNVEVGIRNFVAWYLDYYKI